MALGRPIPLLQLSREERETLERWSRRDAHTAEDRPLQRKGCGPPRHPIRDANNSPSTCGGQAEAGPYTNCRLSAVNFAAEFLCHSSSGDFNRLEDSAPSCGLSTVNCKPALLSPSFTTTSIAIVGAPTFSSSRRPSQLNLDESRMRGRARGQRATGEHAGGDHAGACEGFLAIGGRGAAHVAFHIGEAGAARAGAQMRAG